MKLFLPLFILPFITTISKADVTITSFNNVHQKFGGGPDTRTVVDTFYFPKDLSVFNKINMHVTLNCPAGGCDPWDRFANIYAFHNNEWFEIGRYMTPYGRSCGWVIDVTDYRSMLSDTVILKSFIDTWVNPGWLVHINFEFKSGVPANKYVKVENLWVNDNVVYGDNTQPVNLPAKTKTIDATATGVRLKFVTTGHGQGNTDNAAEFSQKTHSILVNGTASFSQLLWRSNCGTNPCSPQSGTWQYNRAGWCPGADVLPNYYDITSKITPGQSVTLGYQLQNYSNLCRPTNPGCTSGSTCADCNYNYNGHTEPHYKISAQLISYLNSTTGISDSNKETGVSIFPNPSPGIFTVTIPSHVILEVLNTIGKKIWSGSLSAGSNAIDLSDLPKGIYFVSVSNGEYNSFEKLVIE